LPDWLDRSLVTAQVFYAPTDLPAGSGRELRSASAAFLANLAPPSTHDERNEILLGLRYMTITRAEKEEEARERFKLLRRAVADVSADVLREAVDRYAKVEKFFPTAVAELLSYTNAVIAERKHTAHRLARLADAADAADRERERLANDPVTPEAIAAIKAEFGLDRIGDIA